MPLFETKKKTVPPKLLRDKYLVPPFSILDAKSGYWADRKLMWETILKDRENNVRNEVARGNTPYCNPYTDTEKYHNLVSKGTISTFDPFLCEILVKWFSKEGMSIIDPFAGGCVRGIVTKLLNREYWGIDISKAQCDHNWKQWERIKKEYKTEFKTNAVWQCGDSEDILKYMIAKHDMLLTCPPYYNLEKYTDEAEDLSNKKTYSEFIQKYTSIIEKCYNVLRDNSFAVIIVEEIRDSNGIMYGFVPDTINAFRECGFKYYNEMILENRVVSLKIRCPKYFDQSRKVGRHHQNVLVFYKGDEKQIESKFGRFING